MFFHLFVILNWFCLKMFFFLFYLQLPQSNTGSICRMFRILNMFAMYQQIIASDQRLSMVWSNKRLHNCRRRGGQVFVDVCHWRCCMCHTSTYASTYWRAYACTDSNACMVSVWFLFVLFNHNLLFICYLILPTLSKTPQAASGLACGE